MRGRAFFLSGFCCLLTHELDAVRAREWKIFPILSGMGDEAGLAAFTVLHVPIYALLLRGLCGEGGVNRGLVFGLDVFLVVHGLLHPIFRNHPENRFRSFFSHAPISGAGVFGALDLLLELRGARS